VVRSTGFHVTVPGWSRIDPLDLHVRDVLIVWKIGRGSCQTPLSTLLLPSRQSVCLTRTVDRGRGGWVRRA